MYLCFQRVLSTARPDSCILVIEGRQVILVHTRKRGVRGHLRVKTRATIQGTVGTSCSVLGRVVFVGWGVDADVTAVHEVKKDLKQIRSTGQHYFGSGMGLYTLREASSGAGGLLSLQDVLEDRAGRGEEELVGSINMTGHLKIKKILGECKALWGERERGISPCVSLRGHWQLTASAAAV